MNTAGVIHLKDTTICIKKNLFEGSKLQPFTKCILLNDISIISLLLLRLYAKQNTMGFL